MQVVLYDYSVHWADGPLTEKIGSSLFLRRSARGCKILVHLVKSGGILSITSECLSVLLKLENMPLKKNATKTSKVRCLLKANSVVQECSKDELSKVELAVSQLEAKRNKKNATEAEEPEEEYGDEASCNFLE